MEINGYYTGCVKSGNMGDDILFHIFINLLSKCISNKYNVNCILRPSSFFVDKNYNKWIEKSDIGVVGGGSILHPEEISYTIPVENYKKNIKTSFLFGTGITDSPKYKIPEENRKLIISGDYSNINFPSNNLMKFNLDAANNIKFGGMRGPLDVAIAKSIVKNFNKNFIYDPGLISDFAFSFDEINEKNKDKNIIGINLAYVTGENRISIQGENYNSYMNRLKTSIIESCKYFIKEGYNLYFYSMSEGEMHLHNYIIDQIDSSLMGTKIFSHTTPLDLKNLLDVASNFKFAIATRLHANILINSINIPTINLMYNFKALNYMDSVGMRSYGIPTDENLNCENIIKISKEIESNYQDIINNLQNHKNTAINLYMKEINNMLDCLNINLKNNLIIEHQTYNQMLSLFRLKTI